MYYTKLIIEDRADSALNDAFLLVMEERWKLVSDGNGRTKYFLPEDAEFWVTNETYGTLTAEQSKLDWDNKIQGLQSAFNPSVTRHGLIKVWNTELAARAWVANVEALDLPGVTISYHGTTDPTV